MDEALHNLRRDGSIMILPADKGRATVVMDRNDYVTKANAFLGEEEAYRLLDRNPLASMKRRVRNTVKRLC